MLSHEIWHLLLLLLVIILVIPAPSLDEVVNDELDTPAGFLVDLVDNSENLLLLRA